MNVRFHMDPDTGQPHFFSIMELPKIKSVKCCANRAKTVWATRTAVWPSGRRWQDGISK
jgi:hypothetical protein